MTDRVENETELIQTYLAPLASDAPGAFGLKDDAALLLPEPGTGIVVSTDPIIAGVHFFADGDAADIAWKALAVNVSDLAAKGARPLAYTMALAFPVAPERAWMERFAHGLKGAQTAFGCHLIGGDTDKTSGPLSISITAFGTVPHGKFVQRATARLGDHLYVTGTLGDAALGLNLHQAAMPGAEKYSQDDRAFLSSRYLRPRPRLELAPVLRDVASAALDISDGLVKDLARLAAGAGALANVHFEDIPLSLPARRMKAAGPAWERAILTGGDDYEILFSAAPELAQTLAALVQACPFPVTRIGELLPGCGVCVIGATGKVLEPARGGYDHFD